MIMNWRLSVAAVAVLIALGGTAEADVLTAGPVYAGPGQLNRRVFCWLFNTGTTNATISSRKIWSSIKVANRRRFDHPSSPAAGSVN